MASDPAERYRGLDGLRGLAAFVVLIHHVLIVDPLLFQTLFRHPADLPTADKLLAYTPLHVLWAGPEAVLVFFVLSGFVLTLGMLGRRPDWVDYYPRRVVRLYLPTLGALVLALALAAAFRPAAPDPDTSFFYDGSADTGTWGLFWHDATLWHQNASFLNGPLWSLHWEVVFSLALPLYLLLTRVRRAWAAALVALLLVLVSALGTQHDEGNLRFLPVFGLGVLAAAHRDGLRALARRRSPWLAVAGVLLLTAPWTWTGVRSEPDPAVGFAVTVVGAAVLVLAFLDGAVGRWSADTAVIRWLGRRSFSLYLTHVPIVLTVAFLLNGPGSLWLLGLIALPLSLAVAEVFGRFVEEPAHEASKAVGRWAQRRRAAMADSSTGRPRK